MILCAAEFSRQRPNFSVELAEILCQKLATLLKDPKKQTVDLSSAFVYNGLDTDQHCKKMIIN
jgi:hypothetical protein